MLHRLGSCTHQQLADLERVRPPSVTRTVGLLAARGLVERTPDARDRRVTHVSPTEAGRDVLRADRERRDAWLIRRLEQLDDVDREALRRAAPVLHRLAQED